MPVLVFWGPLCWGQPCRVAGVDVGIGWSVLECFIKGVPWKSDCSQGVCELGGPGAPHTDGVLARFLKLKVVGLSGHPGRKLKLKWVQA